MLVVSLRQTYDQVPTAGRVLAVFCKTYSLQPALCQLYAAGKLLADSQVVVRAAASLLKLQIGKCTTCSFAPAHFLSPLLTGLSVQGQNNSNIHLKVDVQPSIALFLFCAVSKPSKDQGSSTIASAEQTLLSVAQISSTHGYIASALSDSQQLQLMMDTASMEPTHEQQLKCSITAPGCRLPESHRPLVLFAQLLALERSLSTPTSSNNRRSSKQHKRSSRAAGQPDRSVIASRLYVITQHGFSDQVQKQVLNEHWQNKAKRLPSAAAKWQQIGSRLQTLRTAFLLLKLASLLNAVKHKDAEHFISVIFSLVGPLAQDLAKKEVNAADARDEAATLAEAVQGHELSLFLIQLLLPLINQHMKVSDSVAPVLISQVGTLLDTELEDILSALSSKFITSGHILHPVRCMCSAWVCLDLL